METQYVIRLAERDAQHHSRYLRATETHCESVSFEEATKYASVDDAKPDLVRLALANTTAFVHPLVKYGDKIVLEEMVAHNLAAPTADLLRTRGPKHYIVALANSFPALHGKIELCRITPDNWNIDFWVKSARPWSHSEREAAMFVAMVWNWSDAKSKKWKFDAVDALSMWDNGNRAAFIAWAKNPVWP